MAFHPVDVHVGSRVRLRRTIIGMSQTDLGNAVGLTFQQIQKYERGANRIGASRVHAFSQILDVPVSFFFDDLPSNVVDHALTAVAVGTEAHDDSEDMEGEVNELVKAYYRIENRRVRFLMRDLVRSAAGVKRSWTRKSS